jgi:predicted nuclease of restriction endonuclease-like (RecB) superfamily
MEFYLHCVKGENYSKRELERQISASLFERTIIGKAKLSPLLREISWSQQFGHIFKVSNC